VAPSIERLLAEALGEGFRSPPRQNLSDWADDNRVLSPEASSEHGRWRTSRVPYLSGPMNAITDPLVEVIVLMFSSQSAKTEALLCALGHTIDQRPGPVLFVEPRLEDCKALSKDRIAPMLRDTPCLRGKVKDARARDSGNTTLHKQFPGGHLTLAGGNSPAGLSMRPIRDVYLDEVSRYPASAGTEGDPVTLAIKRTTTFWDRKIVMASSPALEGSCRITAAYEETDRRKYHVPCPHCDEKQVLEWSRVEWDKDETVSPRRHFPETAAYHCKHCGSAWDDAQRWAALHDGEWIAEGAFAGKAGFWVSQLYSPWKRLGELVQEYLDSRGNAEREKAFRNTVLGLPYRVAGVTADAERLYERRESYRRGEVPDRALVLVAGVDIQHDRIECEVVGYGRGLESWSVDHLVFQGDPTRPEVWAQFDEHVRNETWERRDGQLMKLARIAVDSGDNTAAVYSWWRSVSDPRVMLLKGAARNDHPLSQPSWVEVRKDGRKVKRGVQVWSVGVDYFKSELLEGWLRLPKPEDGQALPGYCHFPHYPRSYFDQLTAEEKVIERTKNGFQRHVWRKVRDRNEALDLRVYARAAAMAERLDAFRERHWSELEERLGVAAATPAGPTSLPQVVPPPAHEVAKATAPAPRTGWGSRAPARGGWGGRRF
jgi:phage terminase large subunit GpA-like protein